MLEDEEEEEQGTDDEGEGGDKKKASKETDEANSETSSYSSSDDDEEAYEHNGDVSPKAAIGVIHHHHHHHHPFHHGDEDSGDGSHYDSDGGDGADDEYGFEHDPIFNGSTFPSLAQYAEYVGYDISDLTGDRDSMAEYTEMRRVWEEQYAPRLRLRQANQGNRGHRESAARAANTATTAVPKPVVADEYEIDPDQKMEPFVAFATDGRNVHAVSFTYISPSSLPTSLPSYRLLQFLTSQQHRFNSKTVKLPPRRENQLLLPRRSWLNRLRCHLASLASRRCNSLVLSLALRIAASKSEPPGT